MEYLWNIYGISMEYPWNIPRCGTHLRAPHYACNGPVVPLYTRRDRGRVINEM
jgi:hypothetical protein